MTWNSWKGHKVSFSKTPQARDDSFVFHEDIEGSVRFLDVMHNDRGGCAKRLFSLDDGTNQDGSVVGSPTSDLLYRDPIGVPGTSAPGATIWITPWGSVAYDTSTLGDLDYLAAGETLTDEFTYAIQLGNGTISWATASVIITGTNDAPTIVLAEDGAVTEDASDPTLSTAGTITFDDPDASDSHSVSAVAAAANSLGGSLSVSVTDVATGAGRGAVSWAYEVGNGATQSLGASESATESFTITVSDGQGGSVDQVVTVTANGVNDAPVVQALAGDSAGTATPLIETDSGLATAGTLTATDVDLTDTVAMSVSSVTAIGNTGGLSEADLLSFFSVSPLAALAANPGDANNAGWVFDSGAEAFNHLLAGEELTLQYTVRATDDSGAADNTGDGVVTVRVTGTSDAVAPEVHVVVLERQVDDPVNLVRLRITAAQTAPDGSNYIDRIELDGVPAGVTVTTHDPLDSPGEPNSVVQFVELLLPPDQDSKLELHVTAFAREDGAAGSEEASTTVDQRIVMDVRSTQLHSSFSAVDQSIWGAGSVVGIDRTNTASDHDGILRYDFSSTVKAGFQSTLHFEGGDIDANLDYDITVETAHNQTTDALLIDPTAVLTGGGFDTVGPSGSFALDFLFKVAMELAAYRAALVGDDEKLFDFSLDIAKPDGSPRDINLVTLTSDDQDPVNIDLEAFPGFSVILQWPQIASTGTGSSPPPGEFSSPTVASNNFFTLNFDVDDFITAAIPLPANPFDIEFSNVDPVTGEEGLIDFEVHAELLDLDLFGGLNVLQRFVMQEQDLAGVLEFEDGSTQAFVFGQQLVIENASAKDIDGDGNIEFRLAMLDPEVTLANNTDLGINLGFNFDLLKLTGEIRDRGPFVIGPVVDLGGSLPVADIDLFDNTFALDFQSQSLSTWIVA